MKEHIDEMKKVLIDYTKKNHIMASHVILEDYAEQLYNEGCRKQSVGEWIQSRSKFGFGQSNCSVCNGYVDGYTSYRYCPHCGTKIQGIRSKEDDE